MECQNPQEGLPVCTDTELDDSRKRQYHKEHSVKRGDKKAMKTREVVKKRQEFGQMPE